MICQFSWRPFWKGCQIGSSSQFGEGGINFSCLEGSKEQKKFGPGGSALGGLVDPPGPRPSGYIRIISIATWAHVTETPKLL